MFDIKKTIGLFDNLYYTEVKGYKAIWNPYSYKSPFVFPEKLFAPLKKILNGKYSIDEVQKRIEKTDLLEKKEIPLLIQQLQDHNLLSYDKEKNHIHINPQSNSEKASFWIDVTNQCNFRCTYCYIDRKKEVIDPHKLRLLLEGLLKQKKDYPFRKMLFILAGGEPLLYFDALKKTIKVLQEFQKNHKGEMTSDIQIITNGSLLTEERAKYFKKEKVRLSISFDGIGAYNDKTRQFANGSGTYSKVTKGIDIAKNYDILANTITTVTSKNIKHLPELVSSLLEREVGFQLQFYKKVTKFCLDEPVVFNDESIGYYLKAVKNVYDWYASGHKKKKDMDIYLDSVKIPFYTGEHGCAAGYNYFTITQNCEIKVCPASEVKIPFESAPRYISAVRNRHKEFVGHSVNHNPVCKKCLWKYQCKGGCKMEQFVTGSTKKAPSTCLFYKKYIPYLINLEVESILRSNGV
ncbi:MAG: radical SAM protein [Candidatus Roizmanbacteria bacterium]|nr:radical SAM protein [Candidatus Roizmanbacteria bacterium]